MRYMKDDGEHFVYTRKCRDKSKTKWGTVSFRRDK